MTAMPSLRLRLYQLSTCGGARRQLMHVYVQKSTSTTLPRRDDRESGRSSGVLNHFEIPTKLGARPRSSSDDGCVGTYRPVDPFASTLSSARPAAAVRSI